MSPERSTRPFKATCRETYDALEGIGAALADLYEVAADICNSVEVLIGELDGDKLPALARMKDQVFYHLTSEIIETARYLDQLVSAYEEAQTGAS